MQKNKYFKYIKIKYWWHKNMWLINHWSSCIYFIARYLIIYVIYVHVDVNVCRGRRLRAKGLGLRIQCLLFLDGSLRSAALSMCCFPPESERGQRDRRHCPSLMSHVTNESALEREITTQFNSMNSSKCFIHSLLPGTDYISNWLLLLCEHQWLLLPLFIFKIFL